MKDENQAARQDRQNNSEDTTPSDKCIIGVRGYIFSVIGGGKYA